MASYDIEHSVDPTKSNTVPSTSPDHDRSARRPDFSTFFSHVSSQTDTTQTQNAHATAMPSDISAAYRLLAEGYEQTRQDNGEDSLVEQMVELLIRGAEAPPSKIEGVGQEFIDRLDRVPRKALKKGMDCPICSNPFLDDKYPLVVRLPCNPKHMFDLECIAPWLKLNATCPMDRKNLVKPQKPPVPPKKQEDDEEEYDDMYA